MMIKATNDDDKKKKKLAHPDRVPSVFSESYNGKFLLLVFASG